MCAYVYAHTLTHTHTLIRRAVIQMDGHRIVFLSMVSFVSFISGRNKAFLCTRWGERKKRGRERGEKKRRRIEGEIRKNIQRSLCFAKESLDSGFGLASLRQRNQVVMSPWGGNTFGFRGSLRERKKYITGYFLLCSHYSH